VGLGNKCDLDEIDFLEYFARDEKTNCLGFYLENIERGRQFLTVAKEVARLGSQLPYGKTCRV